MPRKKKKKSGAKVLIFILIILIIAAGGILAYKITQDKEAVKTFMTKFHKPFTIGLDLGTGSVGYAVIDNEYKLVKLNGRHAWGSALFDNAQTAKARRLFRSARRRSARRKERREFVR